VEVRRSAEWLAEARKD